MESSERPPLDPNKLIPIRQLADRIGVQVTTIRRWQKRGCRGVFLKITFVGMRCLITLADYQEFQRQVDEKLKRTLDRVMKRTPPEETLGQRLKAYSKELDKEKKRQQKEHEQAEEILRRRGVLKDRPPAKGKAK